MTSYDPYDRDYSRRYVREERREERDPRFLDTRDYSRSHATRELVPRAREDSDLSVEEIRRDFPPPQGRDIRRARSAGPSSYYDDDDYDDYSRDYDRRSKAGGSSVYYEENERKPKHKTISKQEKIIAAVAGAALLVGGKEVYDRREANQDRSEVQRNALASAALAGVGALAAYQGAEYYNKTQAKKDQKATYILHRGRDGHVSEYYSDDEEGGSSKEKKGNKNFLESALAATGLGAAVKSFTGGGDKDERSDTRSRRGSRSPSPSRGGTNKVQKAAMASLLAGATEAFRVAKEPGGWKGEKTKRILTAAAGAATVDAAQSRDSGKLGLAESVIGGLVGNRLINGSKNDIEEDKKTGRSRSRSRARSKDGGGGGSGLAALATAGLGAFGAKKAYDSYQSRSRSRAPSEDSRGRYDSRGGSPDRRRRSRSRSRSVVDKARNSLAKLGIGSGVGAVAASEDDHRRTQDDFDDRGSRRARRYSDDMYDDDYRSNRGRDYDDDRSHQSGRRDRSRKRGGRSDYTSESDLGDSDDDEKRARKMKGKQLLTTGLAAVATIHAAHGVYQSMEKRNVRQKAVKEGRLSPAEAKKLKTKALVQDAASVGIAALGVKGAIDEMKEAKNLGNECKEFQEEKVRRHQKRLQKRYRSSQSAGPRRSDTWSSGRRSQYDDDDDYYEPRYLDGNPYRSNTLPAPPVGGGGYR